MEDQVITQSREREKVLSFVAAPMRAAVPLHGLGYTGVAGYFVF